MGVMLFQSLRLVCFHSGAVQHQCTREFILELERCVFNSREVSFLGTRLPLSRHTLRYKTDVARAQTPDWSRCLLQCHPLIPPLRPKVWNCLFIRSHFGSESYYCVDISLADEPLWLLAPCVLQLCSLSCPGNLISQFLLATSSANGKTFWLCHIKTTA